MKRYLLCDTELTNLSTKDNLITLYLGIIEKDKLIDELYLELIPDSGLFIVDPESMNINKIDLRNWKGIPYKDASKLVDDFIRKYIFNEKRQRIDDRLQVIGQAVQKDIEKIQECLISKTRWEEAVERVALDTLTYATILRDLGKFNYNSLSLENMAQVFGLDVIDMHNAKADAILAYQVYKELGKLI